MRHCSDCYNKTKCVRNNFDAENCPYFIDEQTLLAALIGKNERWVQVGEYKGLKICECTGCGARLYVDSVESLAKKKFCYNCGAHMSIRYFDKVYKPDRKE